jgi:hypothetical protein
MTSLGFPADAVDVVADLYTNTSTRVRVGTLGLTDPIDIKRGTIQGDSLSPFLYLIFVLRWLHQGSRGYNFGCVSPPDRERCALPAVGFVDDLGLLTSTIPNLRIQWNKFTIFCGYVDTPINDTKRHQAS